MDTVHILLVLTLVLAIIGLIAALIYHSEHKNKNKGLTTVDQNGQNNQNNPPSAGGIILVIVILIFVIGLAALSIWITLKRYQIAGNAIKQGNTGLALAALSPEIGEGISRVIR